MRNILNIQAQEGSIADPKIYAGGCHRGSVVKLGAVRAFAPDGSPTVGINLRCIEGLDLDKLSPRPWDGRSL